MKFNFLFIVITLLFVQVATASHRTDTMKVAKSLIKNGKFSKAEQLLSAFHKTYPDDLNIRWLYGQAAYWSGHYNTFAEVYEEAIKKFPDNYYLKLDYGLKLLEKGDIQQSLAWLNLYKAYDPNSVDLNIALAKINYWQGDFNEALNILDHASLKKGNAKLLATGLKHEILVAKSPWLQLNMMMVHDDQPLNIVTPAIEAGTYFKPWLSPFIQLSTPLFFQSSSTDAAQSFSIGNKIKFPKAGFTCDASIGLSHLPSSSNHLIGKFEMNKISFRHLELNAGISKQAYLTTVSSIDHAVVPFSYFLNAGWNKQSGWQGKISYRTDRYSDNKNEVSTMGAWFFAPPFKYHFLQVRIGYSFAYSHARSSRFTSRLSLEQLTANSNAGDNTVEGVYNPYFTPNRQQTHSALINILYQPRTEFNIGFNGNIGFYGKTNNPYLYLDSNTYGVMTLYSGYAKINFYPDDISLYILYKKSIKSSFKLSYSLLRNNFYTCHTAGITYFKSFWKNE